MGDYQIIDLTPANIADYGVCGYKDTNKHPELQRKIDWFKEYYPKGLRIKIILSEKGGYQGMLEYIPGEYAHRPVEARGYMFIHCIFVGFKKAYKDKGYGTALIEACIKEARNVNMKGVAVVTRKGSFMVHDEIFIKLGFEIADEVEPDFHLLVKRFDTEAEKPRFMEDLYRDLKAYGKGLFILRSVQCPYTEKNVQEIVETAKVQFQIPVKVIDLEDAESVQASPCPFGSFCMVYNGEIISHHPISNGRFVNIMKKRL